MTQYYYLVASLPLLRFDEAAPLRSGEWLEMCREQVTGEDYELLSRISFADLSARDDDHAAWRAYSSWETALRNELAVQRARRLERDPGPYLREAPFQAGLAALAKEALAAGTPREVETALDRGRWYFLEELETGAQFDLGRLVVYRLKLLLLERIDRFRPGTGGEAFAREYAGVLGSAAASSAPNAHPAGNGEST